MDFVNEGEFACHAKLNPAPTMTFCLPHYPYKYATYQTVNKEKMASYAEILKDDGKENENTNTNINTKSNSSNEKVKPIFLKDEDVFGVFVQDYMDFVNEGGFACHAKLNPAPTMTVCLPHYPYKYATYPR
jgi:hypothetical protein